VRTRETVIFDTPARRATSAIRMGPDDESGSWDLLSVLMPTLVEFDR
jgi:hypothetical protein